MQPTVITRPMAKFKIRSGCGRTPDLRRETYAKLSAAKSATDKPTEPSFPRKAGVASGLMERRHAERALCLLVGSSGARTATRNHRRQRRQHEHRWLSRDRCVVRDGNGQGW